MEDCPGNATSNPRFIEINAATIEIRIVFQIPETKNFILTQPAGVDGLITYHPQTLDEQPERIMHAKHKR